MSKEERFEIFGDKLVKDNEQTPNLLNNYLCCVRLNEFADKVADLEAKLAESESEIKLGEFWHSAYQGKQLDYDKVYAELRKTLDENQQLKQQLHDLPKQIVREINDIALDYWDFNTCEECGYIADLSTLTIKDFDEVLDTILKKYGGENETTK